MMEKNLKLEQIKTDLTELCVKLRDRHVGSEGNKKAARYAADRMMAAGFTVSQPEFDCIDWEYGPAVLRVGDEQLEAYISPYSLSCEFQGVFETASTLKELQGKDFEGKAAVLHGELCKEQLMPKNFVFYNPEEHQQIIRLLEEKKPAAIVAITTRNPEMAGALYPFPLLEDGDFDIPSVYLTADEGRKLLASAASQLYLKIDSNRIPSKGSNVIGAKDGQDLKRIVICAHIDTKKGTTGALDNGTGVAVLLALADMLKDYRGKYGVELLAFNGEDYYAASGQMQYLALNEGKLDQIAFAVNIDGAGCVGYKTSFCCFNCEEDHLQLVQQVFEEGKSVQIDPWYQGDHMLFVMNQIPSVAVSSENLFDISAEIAHTPKDTIKNVDMNKVLEIAETLKDLIYHIK